MNLPQTPGPWTTRQHYERGNHHIAIDATTKDIAHVFSSLKDAMLIAAAPELLDALQAARPWIATDRNAFAESAGARNGHDLINSDDQIVLDGYDAVISSIDAAIAKATGEPA